MTQQRTLTKPAVLDLSLPFDPARFPSSDSSKTSCRLTVLQVADGTRPAGMEIALGNHVGTHIDAPSHLIPGGAAIDTLPLGLFTGTGVVLGLPRGANEPVTAADLEATHAVEDADDIVFISSGWDVRFGTPEYATHHPYLTEGAAHWLISKHVRLVGMDVQSVDLGHSLRPPGFAYTSLRLLLAAGIPVVHSLANLPGLSGRRCELSAVPIGFTGADGAPTRAFARI